MNVKRVVESISIFIKWVVKVWKFYQDSRIEQARKQKEAAEFFEFGRYCWKMANHYKKQGVVFLFDPEIINGICYMDGTDKHGAHFHRELTMQNGKPLIVKTSTKNKPSQDKNKYGVVKSQTSEFQERNVYHNYRERS